MYEHNYSVRQLTSNDWQEFRAIRLKALQQHPDVYLSRYDDAVKEPPFHWQRLLDGKGQAIFGLYSDHQLVGIGAVFTSWDDARAAFLAMGYIDSLHRGKGLSSLLYEARIDWVRAQGLFNMIRVSHRAGNEASRRANQRFSFHYTHDEEGIFIDGKDRELVYEMRIEA